MRGTLYRAYERIVEAGIIPAYAGNTSTQSATPRPRRDHPRVCGEHCWVSEYQMVQWGSSPRMRGTRQRRDDHRLLPGIIPAYAGNTCVRFAPSSASGDHPRVCGEHPTRTEPTSTSWGSSPRMRGTRFRADLVPGTPGIIPAYAGNTCGYRLVEASDGDHPRVCGEHW